MNKGFTYREYNSIGKPTSAGSFRGEVNTDTIEKLVNKYETTVTNSGDVYFVNKNGDKINLYIHIRPMNTKKGQDAYRAWQVRQQKEAAEEYAKMEEERKSIEAAMLGLSTEEILLRLKGV